MFQFSSFVQKAQSLIDPANFNLPAITSSDRGPSKASLFRQQFCLPDSQNPLQEITAELILPVPHTSSSAGGSADRHKEGNRYTGRLHLSERYLCFSTQPTSFLPSASLSASTSFTGQTHGTGPSGNGFTLPLCAIRRVERLNSLSHVFSLALTTWNGALTKPASETANDPSFVPQRFTVQLVGSRQACERFCDGLKKGLREGMRDIDNLRTVCGDCYSEYLLSGSKNKGQEGDAPARQPPDAGLGMVFRYPGDARKLRDRSKMRLWGEYFRGACTQYLKTIAAVLIKIWLCRKWPQCYAHSATDLPQAYQGWTSEPPPWRDLGTYFWLYLRPFGISQAVRRYFGQVFRSRISCYR